MKKEYIHPEFLFDSRQYGFSQIVVSRPGALIFVSGQVAWDENQNIVGEGNLALQTQKSIDNLKIAMEAVGGTLEDIVMLKIYKVQYQTEDGQIISQVLRHNFGTQNPPASTWVSVDGLANNEFIIEIEAQAVL